MMRAPVEKIGSHCSVWFPCSGAGWWIRKHDGGNLDTRWKKKLMNGINKGGNTKYPISGNRLEFVQNKDRFCFFFKIVEI